MRLLRERRRLYVASLIAYVLLRVGFAGFHPAFYTDTADYERTASAPIWSVRFLAGIRGFTLPLLYKIITYDTARIAFQLAFSVVAWSVLALVYARSLRTERGRFVGFALVLIFSLTRYVIGWDPLLLSESLSNSLFALLVAAVLVVVRQPTRGSVAALLAVATAWTFDRDSNGVVVLVGGLVALLLALRPDHRRLKLATAGAAVAISAAGAVTADIGARWQAPFNDVVQHRLREEPAVRKYVLAYRPSLTRERRAYLTYLARHPGYTFVTPFVGKQHLPYSSEQKAASLLDPQLDKYVATLNSAARPLRRVFDVLWIHSLGGVLAFAAVALVGALALLRRRTSTVGWVGVGVLLSTYPAALAAWHLSGMELDRHALGAAVSLRLGAYLLVAFVLDGLFTHAEAGSVR